MSIGLPPVIAAPPFDTMRWRAPASTSGYPCSHISAGLPANMNSPTISAVTVRAA